LAHSGASHDTRAERIKTMGKIDVRKYLKKSFIGLDDVEGGPMTLKIAEVVEGQYDKLNLIFTSGQKFALNKENTGRLFRDLGEDVEDWIDADVKLFKGVFHTQNGETDGVELEVLTPEAKPATKPRGDMDDEIPF
jgi:hypothetical protein